MTLREPLGVIGGIIPWNYPLLAGGVEDRAAIAAGNTSLQSRPSRPASR